MAFLFRKYTQGPETGETSQPEPDTVETEERPNVPQPEFRLFPPSPKAQLVLIAVGFLLLNLTLMAVLAIGVYLNMS